MPELGIIGGTGLTEFQQGEVIGSRDTDYGISAADIILSQLNGTDVAFLARHGVPHLLPPHKVNYRANIRALYEVGVRKIIAINAVGGIRADCTAGSIVIPNQLIDYSYGREPSFCDGNGGELLHIDFTEPFTASLRDTLLSASNKAGCTVIDAGVYGVTQGPRLETAAEIDRMERDGCDLVGMTAMPEAALARELGIDYAMLCIVVNPAAGRSDKPITLEEIHQVLDGGIERIRGILGQVPSVL
jgi:5'-methylthioinosine phosphorylase